MKKKDERIYKVFKTHNGFARTKDILATGIHSRDTKRIRDEGQIIRVKRGLYRLTNIPLISNQGFIDLARAVPEGAICLLSALSYYELTTFNPSVISMAICRGSREPKIEYPPVEFYHFSKKQFEAGISNKIKIKDHEIRIYNPEKIAYFGWISFDDEYESIFQIMVKVNDKEAYWFDCHVIPQYRHNGLHSAVTAKALIYLKDKGCKKVLTHVMKDNIYSRKAFEKVGFKEKRMVTLIKLFNFKHYTYRDFKGKL